MTRTQRWRCPCAEADLVSALAGGRKWKAKLAGWSRGREGGEADRTGVTSAALGASGCSGVLWSRESGVRLGMGSDVAHPLRRESFSVGQVRTSTALVLNSAVLGVAARSTWSAKRKSVANVYGRLLAKNWLSPFDPKRKFATV